MISLENQNNEELVDNIVNDKYELARIRRETFPSIKQLYTTKKEQNSFVRVCAPMVRYSRLPFRLLVREFGCDLVYTPMLISDSFTQSDSARDADFRTNYKDGPLIVQFAANKPETFGEVARALWGHCEGIGLNCGCPQRWVNQLNYGDILMKQPELLADILKAGRRSVPDNEFCIELKMRVFEDTKLTVELARRAEHVGIGLISIHGRTHSERDDPVRAQTIKTLVDTLSIPVNYNGSIYTDEDAIKAQAETGAGGVMVARGLLANPGLFDGRLEGDKEVLTRWTELAIGLGIPFTSFHKHIMFMMENVTMKAEKRMFNGLQSTVQTYNWLKERNYIY